MKLEDTEIAKKICENIKNRNVYFVFGSYIIARSWMKWCVENPGVSNIYALECERFLAWDNFKSNYLSVSMEGLSAIPTSMRKIFVRDLLLRNAGKVKEPLYKSLENAGVPFFKRIINPSYSADGENFTDWLSSVLPSLNMWAENENGFEKSNSLSPEDEDYKLLYHCYKEFLAMNKFYEQSWEEPSFSGGNKKFIVFYPQILDDFFEFKSILFSCKNIECVSLKKDSELMNKVPSVFYYSDSRKELRKTALRLRRLYKNSCDEGKKFLWTDVALHVPEIEIIRPYLERELKLYSIPYVVHVGSCVSKNSSGNIFKLMQNVYSQDFSYDSVRALLLDGFIPWIKGENGLDLCSSLIQFGQENHCVCSYSSVVNGEKQKHSTWEESLSSDERNYALLKFFKNLKAHVVSICTSPSFEAIRKEWNSILYGETGEEHMYKKFPLIDVKRFTEEKFVLQDKVLSRCIIKLEELISLENDFIKPNGLEIGNHFEFFVNQLDSMLYSPLPEKKDAVNIYTYKTAASAAFKYNFILNCNQKSLQVVNVPLKFLSDEKRKLLGFDSLDVTNDFIALYNMGYEGDKKNVVFSAAEDSFSGFAIPNNRLVVESDKECLKVDEELDELDFVLNEKKCFLGRKKFDSISEKQIAAFNLWKNKVFSGSESGEGQESENLLLEKYISALVNRTLVDGYFRSKDEDESYKGKIKITQTDLNSFFPCPRKWLLSKVFNLEDEKYEASLMDNYEEGRINHKILELLFNEWKDKKSFNGFDLPCIDETCKEEKGILDLISKCFLEAIESDELDYNSRPLVKNILLSQEIKFVEKNYNFLKVFCDPKNFGSYNIKATEFSKHCFLQTDDVKTAYALFGKIDCILTKDNKDYVVDFKTTYTPSQTANQAAAIKARVLHGEEVFVINDFQMPLYEQLLLNDETFNVVQGNFASIGECEVRKPVYSENTLLEYKNHTLPLLKDYCDYFYDSVTQKKFTPKNKEFYVDDKNKFYLLDVKSDCVACKFNAICRKHFIIAGHKNETK